jgi:Zn-dependent protease with chaperone function
MSSKAGRGEAMIRIDRIPFVILALTTVLMFFVIQMILYLMGQWGGMQTGWNLIEACVSPLEANPISEEVCRYAVSGLSIYSLLRLGTMFFRLIYMEIKWRLLFEGKRNSLLEKHLTVEYPQLKIRVLNDEAFVALTKGFLRPFIYISSGVLDRFEGKEVEAILLHEQHHCLSRDPLKIWLVTLLTDAFGYIPFIRKVAQYFLTLREVEADRFTVKVMGTIEFLGSVLYNVSLMTKKSTITLGTASFADHSVNFRILHLLEPMKVLRVPLMDKSLLAKSALILSFIFLIILGGCI